MFQAAIILFLLLLPSAVYAQKRVALVIGNSAYQNDAALPNPRHDAADMAAALRSRGFRVIDGYDLTKSALESKVQDFARALQGAEAGLFFYAGHGVQVYGQNYIIPVDARLASASGLELETVRFDVMQRIMENEAPTNILFLDACRDNPFTRNLMRNMGTRSAAVGRGLAPVASGLGTLVSFSTQPGNVALDSTGGRNSPFSGALVKHISSSNEDLNSILIAVRKDVMEETQRRQIPWEHSALTGRFYFNNSLKEESDRQAKVTADAEAKRKAAEVEQQRLAAAKADEERKAKAAAEAEARAKAEQAEKERLAAAKAEEERKAKAAAEAEAKRKAEEAEQQQLAALSAEEGRRKQAEALVSQGYRELNNRDNDRAIADASEAIRLDPKSANAFISSGASSAAGIGSATGLPHSL
jgi:uncharacterized caspase-like protein